MQIQVLLRHLQATSLCPSLSDARYLYDQLLVPRREKMTNLKRVDGSW